MTPLEVDERSQIMYARQQIKKMYPGIAGEVLAQEITSYLNLGYRFNNKSLMSQLIEYVLRESPVIETVE